jgi:thiosulfate reductase/polysulfide reductase chain A
MPEETQVRTNCRFCGYQCGLIATVEQGRVTGVAPDPVQFPFDESIQRGCRRWRIAPEWLDHPQRINHPLKRVGERGSGEWQRITWEQALDEIAGRLQALKERYGPETLATNIGGPHTTYWPLHRFLSLFGSPNNMGIGQICWNPGTWMASLAYGWTIENEIDPGQTACAILWGLNPGDSDNSLLWRTILDYRRTGKPLIVVDPRRTRTARQASLWLGLRPGTDAVLALGLLQVIVSEHLYDASFVSAWCHGFERLAEHLAPYAPPYVESITGVRAESVVEAARLYATSSPATLFSGRGIDQLGRNTVPAHHALAILRAITGNVGVPGASHLNEMPDFIPEIDLELSEKLPPQSRRKQLGGLLLQSYPGYDRVRQVTLRHGKRLPMRYLTSAHPNAVWRAMLTGQPYPVRSLIVMASNPLLTQADSRLIYQAMKSLDLMVVLELFQTPTAMLADYTLPSAGPLERPLLETIAGTANRAYGGEQAVAPYYERRTDYYFWRELGLRLGQAEDWPWETWHDCLKACLAPTGVAWEEFCRTGFYGPPDQYYQQDLINPETGRPAGFATVSGKVELYSEILAELGGDPLPTPRPISVNRGEYPLLLLTGARFHPYYASSFRQFESLRAVHPEPWAEMSAATAARLGLQEGSPVWVETERGRARFSLKITRMCDDVVSVEYGWWDPRLPASEPSLGGAWVSNANLLTGADLESSDPLVGTWTYNGIPCRVAPA